MANNFIDAVKEHAARLAEIQTQPPLETLPPDLDALWETLSPSLQKALDDREKRLVDYVKTMKGKT